ncbi:MAG TPA: hypothetical protein VI912_02865 [Candidatus Bilamarchaeaceae archaeon]|nr:hypothetical protein [Candidatus Bilamarchaeaceae archaeon]
MLEKFTDSLKEFYSSNNDIALSYIKFRHFRFELADHTFFKVQKPIKTEKQLLNFIKGTNPLNAYYSVGKWINPHKLEPFLKAKRISGNLFLGADIAFDIDFKPFSIANIEKARLEAVKLYELLKYRFPLKYISFSGGKGFHLLFDDINNYKSKNPFERELEVKKNRKKLVDEVKQLVKIDTSVTVDPRRILRIPGTINSSTGYQCRIISDKELETSAKEILKNTKRVNHSALRTFWDDFRLTPIRNLSKAARAGASSAFTTFVTNSVLGAKDRCVPFFEYESVPLRFVEKSLLKVQKLYSLSDIYIFQYDNNYHALSLDSLSFRRVVKIVKAAKCSFWKLVKYKYLTFPLDDELDSRGRILFPKPKLVKVLTSIGKHQKSRGHKLMLEKHFNIRTDESNLSGKNEYKLMYAAIEV